jgi:hypothetical protein
MQTCQRSAGIELLLWNGIAGVRGLTLSRPRPALLPAHTPRLHLDGSMHRMKLLSWIDGQIIDRVYQPAIDRLHVSVQEVCRFCLVGVILSNVYSVYIQVQGGAWNDVVVRAVGLAFAVVIYSRLSSLAANTLNPYRIAPTFVALRYFVISMGVLELYLLTCQPSPLHINDSIESIVGASFWYFVACTEPRPKKRWQREQVFAGA